MLKKILKIILKTYFLQFDISQFFGLIWKKNLYYYYYYYYFVKIAISFQIYM